MNSSYSHVTHRPLEAGNNRRLSRLGEWLVCRWLCRTEFGELKIMFPSGVEHIARGVKPGPHADLHIHDVGMVFRLLRSGDTGFAEAYMAGDWETSDLRSLLSFGHLNEQALSGALGKSWAMQLVERLRHAVRANSKTGSRRNIAAHYDLGNDFYAAWLDPTMSYSSALFEDISEPMIDAQRRKNIRLCEKLDLQPGDRVLEIGCGWGGFAELAAREYGCQIVGLTLSKEQAAYARTRMEENGLSSQVEIRVQDYRDVQGTFDKIVSVEMFEAVGERYWPVYLDALDRLLKPGGKAALQIITIDEDAFEIYRRNPDFIQRYIFPGGMLPSPAALHAVVDRAGLKISDAFYFAASYDETLRRWDKSFRKNWHQIQKFGFDRRFYRMWRYYLCYCMIGFEQGTIDVGQFVIERK